MDLAPPPVTFARCPGLPGATQQDIRATVAGHRTLEDVVLWGIGQSPPVLIARMVTQDEYTQDVVVAWSADVYVVYDTT